MFSGHGAGKSPGNLAEPLFFSFTIPIAALTRVMVGKRVNEHNLAVGLIIALSVFAAFVFWFTPSLPE